MDALKKVPEFDGTVTTLGTPFFSRLKAGPRVLLWIKGFYLLPWLIGAFWAIYHTPSPYRYLLIGGAIVLPALLFLVAFPAAFLLGGLTIQSDEGEGPRKRRDWRSKWLHPDYLFINSDEDEAFRVLAILFQHANLPIRPRFRNANWSSSCKWAKLVPIDFLKAQPEAVIAFTIFFVFGS